MHSILLVDDDADLVEIYTDLLEKMGFEGIFTASNGEEAVSKYKKCLPDLVLMDNNMPKMNGVEAYFAIKEFDSNANVVFLTSDYQNPEMINLRNTHNLDIIPKYISLSILEETISRFFEN